MQAEQLIKNDAVLKANGYSDKTTNSTGTVEKKKLFEKESVSEAGSSALKWDIKVNLNEKYTKDEISKMSDVTITDVLASGLEFEKDWSGVYDSKGNDLSKDDYQVITEGQTVQIKLLHPGKTPEVVIRIYATAYGDFDSLVNKASLVVNNKKINTKSEPIEDVKAVAYSRGWIRSYSAKLPDTTGTIRLTKTDSVSKNRLPGVTFTLTDVNGAIVPVVKDDTGYHYMTDEDIDIESKDELVTNSVGEIVVTGLPVGKYYFTESKALSGYMKNTEKYEANLTKEDIDNRENKDIQFVKDIEATNAPTRVSIEKTNIETKELIAGAKLAIYKTKDMDGNVPKEDAVPVKTWTSESSAKEIDALIPGEYVLYEQKAPAGYLQAEPVRAYPLIENPNIYIPSHFLLAAILYEIDWDESNDEDFNCDKMHEILLDGEMHHFSTPIKVEYSEISGKIIRLQIGQITINASDTTDELFVTFDSVREILSAPCFYSIAASDTKKYDDFQLSDLEKELGLTSADQDESAKRK